MSGRIASKEKNKVTLDELMERPEPQPMGRMHRPIAYKDIIQALDEALENQGHGVQNRELVLARGGKLLMGLYHLENDSATAPGDLTNTATIGIMASEEQVTSLRIRGGMTISLCDNLCMFGGDVIVAKKYTLRAQLLNRIDYGIALLDDQKYRFQRQMARMVDKNLSDEEAATKILRIAAGDPKLGTRGVVPFKYAKVAYDEYFDPKGDDTRPRNEWGLYNAWTRALREAPIQSKMNSTIALASQFGRG